MMELAPPWASVVLAIVLATVVFLITPALRRNRDLPPGPRPWPVIGNLNLIGPLPHRSLRKLSERYGPVMSLRFGAFPVVVGSSAEAARSFLKTSDLAFLDRPAVAAARYTFYNSSSMMWMPYGDPWRQARKLWQTELLSARQLRAHEHVRAEEVRAMLRGIRAAAAAAEVVQVRDHVHMAVLGVISRMVLGKKYVSEAGSGSATTPEEFRWMIDELFFLNGVFNVGDLVPWLGWLDPHGYVARMKKVSRMIDAFLERVLEEHDERRRREGEAFVARDMVDLLLQLADDPDLSVPITRDGVKASTLELIAAATDTSVSSVEWAMSELLRRPEAMAKAAEELERVVGGDRAFVAEGDIPGLPYLDAVVRETMRLHPVSPLLTPRVCREDRARVGGYRVPRGTRVHINVWAIARDPKLWDAPEEFRPDRFLLPSGSAGTAAVDLRGHDFELLPFGSGRRMCPGMGLGLRMVHLALANLLRAFAWRLPDGVAPGELDMEEVVRMTMLRKVPLRAVAEPKLPDHLYYSL